MAAFFAALALLNEVVWFAFSTDVLGRLKTFGATLAIFWFLGINIVRSSAPHSVESRIAEQ